MSFSRKDTYNQPLVLTIDIGSSSLRTNLFTADAVRMPDVEAQLDYDLVVTPDGGVEVDPGMLLNKVFSALDATLQRAGNLAGRIVGVGVCSLVSNVMGVDSESRPTTPIYTWADTRCAPQARQLRAILDQREVLERTGCPIHTSYLPARLLWLRQTMHEEYARTTQWISLGDWLYLNLFGRTAQSLSVASWNGLLNRHTLAWDDALLRLLGLDKGYLPPLVDADRLVQGLHTEYAERWPALREVPWYPCVGDGATGNLGSGCYSPEALAVQVGTSGAMRALVPGGVEEIPMGLWCYRLDSRTALLGGALSEGGNLFDWLREVFKMGDLQALEREAAQLPPDSHGLTVLPFIAGERSIGWHGSARATISGISLSTRPAHIFRAAQEAIAFRFAAIYELLLAAIPLPRRIVASGGALLGVDCWMQVLADVLGHPVTASTESEASSKGAAMLTLRSLGILSDFSRVSPSLAATYYPNSQNYAIYRTAMQRQRELYQALLGDTGISMDTAV